MENMGTETEDGLVTLQLNKEDAVRLKKILAQRSNTVQKPRITREGNKIIIDTGLDAVCTLNKGLQSEIHVLRVYQRAGSHQIDEEGHAINPIPAISIVETVEGDFKYMDGKFVDKKSDLEILSPEYYGDAITWFEKRYPSGKAEKASSAPTPAVEFAELSLKERVICLAGRGISGKDIAKKLRCNEGTVSIHKKSAVKQKYLSKDGKKFTPLGLEKYGEIAVRV